LRTSVAQQTGLPELQRPTWRSSREAGAAKAAAAKARMMAEYCMMLEVVGKEGKVVDGVGELVVEE
jgi:hypothetical protein